MQKTFVGRVEEQALLQRALDSKEAEMISVIGRRRVGKTFLINSFFEKEIVFSVTGIQNASREMQLKNFSYWMNEYSDSTIPYKIPSDWLEAFQLLVTFLKSKKSDTKQVVFFDEVPWMSTQKSDFLQGLSAFWNNWAVKQNIIVVICGSAASWMIKKIVNHRGGLHNRITKRIHLHPFTLAETELYLQNRNIHFDRYQIIQLYMAMGGIPHYLKEIVKGKSVVQNINQICFSETGLLKDEYSNLYTSLFNNAEKHISVVEALAKKRQGLTRNQLVELTGLSAGSTITRVLEELNDSGFIAAFHPFDKAKKDKLYRLTDEYSLFYLKFIAGQIHEGDQIWNHLSQTQQYKIWSGYSFESVCLKHIPKIKQALGIAGIYSISGSFFKKGTAEEKGAQIDLLIDRNDHVINLFEIKFYNEPYAITKNYNDILREKTRIFKETTKTRKQISWVFISTFGLIDNAQKHSLIEQELTLDAFF